MVCLFVSTGCIGVIIIGGSLWMASVTATTVAANLGGVGCECCFIGSHVHCSSYDVDSLEYQGVVYSVGWTLLH